MAIEIRRRRGTTVTHNTFTGAAGEITVDTTKNTVVVHDGATVGGTPLATESSVTTVAGNVGTVTTGLSDHLADTVDAHDASAISNVPAGNISAVTVQADRKSVV
jgi:hypothetical protein